ncbi:immunity 42 family protein [Xenorhabdus sp. Vera]|uniref:immunity 42 family protein n=1 Tax=Xenorhabdus koppenhoeferi TaxID=351659 RepID=UPI0019C17830|nr:immunity 42 family protein [Xenorhabdus sp. Vera]MBD2812632.1 immunity 42 family protein [Xenorhabdus sp. Vera]
MIHGNPTLFSISYEVIEYSEDHYWKFGIFNFIINDEIYPAKGSNYTLRMAFDYLKDSQTDILNCKIIDMPEYFDGTNELSLLAHSHGILLDIDPDDMVLPELEPVGVFLSPLEIADIGFYLFYYLVDLDTEILIYSSDYGVNIKKVVLPRGTVIKVISELPRNSFI